MTTLVPPAGGPEVGDRPVIAAPYENLSELTAGLLTLPLVTMTSTWSESPAACVGTLARVMVVPFGLTAAETDRRPAGKAAAGDHDFAAIPADIRRYLGDAHAIGVNRGFGREVIGAGRGRAVGSGYSYNHAPWRQLRGGGWNAEFDGSLGVLDEAGRRRRYRRQRHWIQELDLLRVSQVLARDGDGVATPSGSDRGRDFLDERTKRVGAQRSGTGGAVLDLHLHVDRAGARPRLDPQQRACPVGEHDVRRSRSERDGRGRDESAAPDGHRVAPGRGPEIGGHLVDHDEHRLGR